MYVTLHPRGNVNRLYLHRKEGGRGLISVEDCVRLEELSLDINLIQSDKRQLKAARKKRNVSEMEHPDEYKRRENGERVKN